MQNRHDERSAIPQLVLIGCLAAGIRLLYMPAATASSADRAIRVWRAWKWLEDPELITHGLWGPLHRYMIAAALAIGGDPVYAPVLINVFFETLTPALLFVFAAREFKSRRAGLLVALSYALYPLAIFNTVGGMVQPPFTFFMTLTLVLVSFAREERATWKHAAAAGLALTFASMLRYEGWMLIPLLAVLLWRRPALAAIFVATAMLHPLFWMIGNWVHEGDPLYSITITSHWERVVMGRAEASLGSRLALLPDFFGRGLLWMTPPAAAASLLGATITLVRRDRAAVWLVPAAGLLCLLAVAVTRGSLAPKTLYTATVAVLLLPYSAATWRAVGVDATSPWRPLAALAVVLSMLCFSYPRVIRHVLPFSVEPIPRCRDQDAVKALAADLTARLRPADGLVSDFYGWAETNYAALLTRHHPGAMYMAPGAPNQEVKLDDLAAFLADFPEGVLVLHRNSRFTEALGGADRETIRIGDAVVALQRLRSMPWSPVRDERLRGTAVAGEPEMVLYRYACARP